MSRFHVGFEIELPLPSFDHHRFDNYFHLTRKKKYDIFYLGSKGSPGITSPIVKNKKVVGFSDDWFASRVFPVDMAGFAVNVNFLSTR